MFQIVEYKIHIKAMRYYLDDHAIYILDSPQKQRYYTFGLHVAQKIHAQNSDMHEHWYQKLVYDAANG